MTTTEKWAAFGHEDTKVIWGLILQGQQAVTRELQEMLGEARFIDEMGLMFADSQDVMSFVSDSVRETDIQLFNYAEDTVRTEPLRSGYEAAYWFLTSGYEFRVEAMMVSEGSPLHTVIRQRSGLEAVCSVHASFKCFDEEDYAVTLVSLRNAGWELVQRCTSGYGKFSYWAHMDRPEGWLIKPRLNTRDAS